MSVGHCTGMCGPLVLAWSAPRAGAKRGEIAGTLATYHAGRLTAYVILGAVLGGLGGAFGLLTQANTPSFQAGLSFGAGILMLGAVIGAGALGHATPSPLWARFAAMVRSVFGRVHRLGRLFALGLTNGLLPCGATFAVLIRALATGHAREGMIALSWFGLGTVPALALIALGYGRLSSRSRLRMTSVARGLIVVASLQLLLRSSSGWGFLPSLSLGPFVIW